MLQLYFFMPVTLGIPVYLHVSVCEQWTVLQAQGNAETPTEFSTSTISSVYKWMNVRLWNYSARNSKVREQLLGVRRS